jgi:hypothetical protein
MSLETYQHLVKRMAYTLATCHSLLDKDKVRNQEIDMYWVFDDIEKDLEDARILLGAKVPKLPVTVDENGNEKVIRPF